MKRIASLDLMRGVAAFSVAIPHYLLLRGSTSEAIEIVSILAVEVFFTLSGFVLAPQILQCMESGQLRDLRTFLVRRWMRTVPPYLVALVVVAVLSGQLFTADFVRTMFYVQNLFAQHNTVDLFPIAWSLSVEEWFYVTFPVLAFGVAKLAQGRFDAPLVTVLSFVAIITMIRAFFGDDSNWGFEVRRVVLFRIDSVAYGFLLYLMMHRQTGRPPTVMDRPWAAGIALVAAGAVAALTSVAISVHDSAIAKAMFPFAATVLGVAAIRFFYSLTPAFERHSPLNRFGDFMGKISYSVYLFHIIVAQFILHAVASWLLPVQIAVFVAILVGFCAIFFVWFEKPILAARPNYTRAEESVADGLAADGAVRS